MGLGEMKAQVGANFSASPQSGCAPLIVQFTDLSTGSPTSWSWDFGNGATSTIQNPSTTYLNAGNFTVTLIVSDGLSSDTLVQQALISVPAPPTPDFNFTNPDGCAPHTVSFQDLTQQGSNPLSSWLWDFGDGNTSTSVNPNHTYTSPGVFSVTLLVTDAAGCSNFFTLDSLVHISAQPQISFVANPTFFCDTPAVVQFQNTSPDPNLVLRWDFGNGFSSNLQNPTTTYTSTGVFPVSLVGTDSAGCSDTLSIFNQVTIFTQEPQFSLTDTVVCVGDTIFFQNLSSPSPQTWIWDYGFGRDTSQSPMMVVCDSVGTFDVALYIENANGCRDTLIKPGHLTVYAYPMASFTVFPGGSCNPTMNVQFNDLSSGALTWNWDFGDGGTSTLQNPSHTYNGYGFYDVTLIVTGPGGCPDTLTLINAVNLVPLQALATGDTLAGCVPLNVDFSQQSISVGSAIVSCFWDFGDGTTSTVCNPSHTYLNPGVYTVTLVVTNAEGCTDTTVYNSMVQVGIKPTANFGAAPRIVCGDDLVQFTDSSINATTWFWSFGDGNISGLTNPTHAYQDTGFFSVTLIVGNQGCFDTLRRDDYIYVEPPIVRFNWTPAPLCEGPDTVQFNNLTMGGTSFLWDFGPLGTSTVKNPEVYFPNNSLYLVTLIAFDSTSGCSDTLSQPLIITSPTVDFATPDTLGCSPLNVQFSDSSSGSIVTWLWNFGDTITSTLQNPTHTYNQPGFYNVSLRITTAWGCTLDVMKPAYVRAVKPLADFNSMPNPGCLYDSLQFNDRTFNYNIPIVSWNWDFGDGGSSLLQNPLHAYNTSGIYTVSLTVEDSLGCRDTLIDTAHISISEVNLSLALDTVRCIELPLQVNNYSTGAGLSHIWDFGDGDSSFIASPSHLYDTTGIYSLNYTVSDSIGCEKLYQQDITVIDPFANFSASPTLGSCPPLLVQFSDSSDGQIVAWFWDFGDGATSTQQNPSHLYTIPGQYDVTLTAFSAGGCSRTLSIPQMITLGGPYGSFSFQPDEGCAPLAVQFQSQTTNTTVWTWDFGDGNVVSGGGNIAHNYLNGGTFIPILIVEDALGCQVPLLPPDTITVYPLPQADFTSNVQTLCGVNDSIRFNDLSGGAMIQSWFWDFGDGNTDTVPDPVHWYSNFGSYTVSLIVVSVDGCTDTLSQSGFINYFPRPSAAFTYTSGNPPAPFPVFFQNGSQSQVPVASYAWDFGDNSGSAQFSPTHVYSTCGDYPVTLIVTDQNGCMDTASQVLTPYPEPQVSVITPVSFCEGTAGAQLNGFASGVAPPFYYTWWCDSTNTFCGLDSIYDDDPMALPDTSTWYYLQVTDNIGCQSPLDSVWVEVLPRPIADAGNDVSICAAPGPGTFLQGSVSNSAGPFQTYWLPGRGLSDSTILNPYARPDTTTIYTLVAVDLSTGCSSDRTTVDTLSTVTVHVKPLPVADAGPDLNLCFGDSLRLQGLGTGAGPAYRYEWSPSNSLSDSTLPNPLANPNLNTEYTLVVWSNGCPSYGDTVRINVRTNPTADAGPDRDICFRESIQLNGTAGGDSTSSFYTYQWWPAVTLNDPNLEDPTAVPDSSRWYYFEASSAYGCKAPIDSVWIQLKPTPLAEAGPAAEICAGDSLQLQGGYTYGSTAAVHDPGQIWYAWTPGAVIGDTTRPDPWAWPSQTQWLYLQVQHNTCLTLDSVLVNVLPAPQIALGADSSVLCSGDSIRLFASGGLGAAAFSWYPAIGLSDSTSDSPMAAPPESQTYYLSLTEGSCASLDSVHLEVIPTPQADYLSSLPGGCVPHTVNFLQTASDALHYIWDFGDGSAVSNQANPEHTYASPGRYQVSLIAVNTGGCEDEINDLWIEVADSAQADFTAEPPAPSEIFLPDARVQFLDLSREASAWTWDFGDGIFSDLRSPEHRYTQAGIYFVNLTVRNDKGCLSRVKKGPWIVSLPDLDIPNVFTPNGDGFNDFYLVNYNGNQPFLMRVFDRWGVLLFEGRDKNQGWDGTDLKGKNVVDGVYYYEVRVGGREFTGSITLMR